MIVATSAAYARRDAISPFRAMLCRTVIAFAGMVGAMVSFEGIGIIWALGLSFSGATLVSAAYLHWRQRRLRDLPKAHSPFRFAGELGASLSAVVPGWIVFHTLSPSTPAAENFLISFAAVAVSGLTYLAAQWLRGSREFSALFTFGERARRRKAQLNGAAGD
jgi:putative peptidoglycan lipid II flippase